MVRCGACNALGGFDELECGRAARAVSRQHRREKIELIDFESGTGSRKLTLTDRLSHGGIHVVRGSLSPSEGSTIGASQLTVAIHIGEPFDMEWRPPGSDRFRTTRIEPGSIHVSPADTPFFQRWATHPRLLVIAFDREVIDSIASEAFEGAGAMLRTEIGVIDPAIAAAIPIWQREMDEGGPGGRLFVESLGIATAVHLFRNYSDGQARAPPIKGGLGSWRFKRVCDYIEEHLDGDLSVSELAAVVGLSAHHFGLAFRTTAGIPPHRYVVARRIERAKLLLLSTDATVTEVALAVGFASHGHFSDNFHRLTGVTPSRFRLDRL